VDLDKGLGPGLGAREHIVGRAGVSERRYGTGGLGLYCE